MVRRVRPHTLGSPAAHLIAVLSSGPLLQRIIAKQHVLLPHTEGSTEVWWVGGRALCCDIGAPWRQRRRPAAAAVSPTVADGVAVHRATQRLLLGHAARHGRSLSRPGSRRGGAAQRAVLLPACPPQVEACLPRSATGTTRVAACWDARAGSAAPHRRQIRSEQVPRGWHRPPTPIKLAPSTGLPDFQTRQSLRGPSCSIARSWRSTAHDGAPGISIRSCAPCRAPVCAASCA